MPLNGRWKLVGVGILFCLALGLTVFGAVRTVQAVQGLQQSRRVALAGDVRSIRPWMTISYIAHVYHVPESYLLQSLQISDPGSVRHVTLNALAQRLHRAPAALIHEIQAAILTYRKQHPSEPPSAPTHSVMPPPTGRKMA